MSQMGVALGIVLLVGLVGACGGADEEPRAPAPAPSTGEPLAPAAYQARIQAIVQESARAGELFFDVVAEERPPEECGRLTAELATELEGIVAAVEATVPPREVAVLQADFVAAARESVVEVRAAAARAGAGELVCGAELNAAIYDLPSTRRAERLLEEIEAAGYVVLGQ